MKSAVAFPTAERFVFHLLLAANLVPLWAFQYFLTCDGPCHLYNAKVLLDFWQGGEPKAFYETWLYLNTRFEPNWFGHAFMTLLMGLQIPAFLAEKLLQTVYVLAFGLGLRYLIQQINPSNLFLSSFGLLFAHHYVFQMGFYNYSCSLAAMFWATGYWLHIRRGYAPGQLLVLAIGLLVLYFCHPVGLLFTLLLIGSLLVGDFWNDTRAHKRDKINWQKFGQAMAAIAVATLPVVVLFAEYLFFKGINATPRGEPTSALWHLLRENRGLLIMDISERWWAVAVAVACALMALHAAYNKLKNKDRRWTDALLGVFLFTVWLYFNQPGSVAGGGITPLRLVLLPYLTLILWLASTYFSIKLKRAVLVFSVVVSAAFLTLRFPHYKMANEAVQEYASCAAVIPNYATVLPISFNHHGQIGSGRYVAEAIWLFVHAGDYVGVDKHIVLLGNYEAHTRNFPLVWREGRNPFVLLSKDGDYFEEQPPRADILGLPDKTGGAHVDYVVTWCKDQRFQDHPYTQEINQQLEQGYDLIFISEHGLAKVFKRKGI
ncbi:MAG: hypothetical protein KIS77_11580 [Saprospiraceae bacterium]|nr:hypothetical protein [Saprospiraceae bacterium]